jgi:cytochrome c553
MMKMSLSVLAGTFALLFSVSVAAQGVDRAELLASMCVTCHGPGGQGSKRIPALDNHTEQEFLEYLNGFKSGEERATIMDRHANGYSDEEFRMIARYFQVIE